jgi:hypothetical protein
MSKIYLRGFSRDADVLWQYLLSFEIPRSMSEQQQLFFEAEAQMIRFERLKTQMQQIYNTSEFCLAPILQAPSAGPAKKLSK